MLDRIKRFFDGVDGNDKDTGAFADKELAAACLLVEAARLDGEFGPREHGIMRAHLQRFFNLGEADANDLIEEAVARHADTTQILGFTRAIKDAFSHDERIEIIEMLWAVVYADGKLHPYEDNLLRRVGGLLYVTDQERGEARKRALARLDQ